jgi:hypothetical protein
MNETKQERCEAFLSLKESDNVLFDMQFQTFRRIVAPSSSGSKTNPEDGGGTTIIRNVWYDSQQRHNVTFQKT